VDETYNSNPLSLKTAIENYDKIESKNSKKYLILGDMLELGKHSEKQHKLISKIINKTKINKVYVIGKYIKETFKRLKSNKKAKQHITKIAKVYVKLAEKCFEKNATQLFTPSDCNDVKYLEQKQNELFTLGIRLNQGSKVWK